MLEIYVPFFFEQRVIHFGSISITLPILLLTATTICSAVDLESFCEHAWL